MLELHQQKNQISFSVTVMEEYSFANSSTLDFPVNVRMLVPV